ncbi:MAG: hypothetical protein Q9219_000392 [cf. Caloplaca sp. 3 TL-2023]
MANGYGNESIFGPDLSLTSNQQSLLRAALSSNTPDTSAGNASPALDTSPSAAGTPVRNGSMKPINKHLSPQNTSIHQSPMQSTNNSLVESFPLDDSPFMDGQDFEDGNFDWDENGDQLFGDLPGAPSHEEDDIHDKRKSGPDGEIEDGKNKRHEGNDKNNKKPGRKPLNSSEPTTKRKAQNRAAQRAFRERKERHLKDLEAKVEDLEKASEATNHENGRLRATVERLNTEVKEYRKRLSLNGAGYSPPGAIVPPMNRNRSNNNDFQFAFPKFGDLPGSSFMNNGSLARISTPNKLPSGTPVGNVPGAIRAGSSNSGNGRSPTNTSMSPVNPNPNPSIGTAPTGGTKASSTNFQDSGMEDLSGLFSPSILASASRSNSSDYMFPFTDRPNPLNSKPSSTESPTVSNPNSSKPRASSTSITASPSVSSVSHAGMDSSCGTTPEPSADSPGHRKSTEGTLNTINEESGPKDSVCDKNKFCGEWANTCNDTLDQAPLPAPQSIQMLGPSSSVANSTMGDTNGIDWMARQNGGQFDPVLFGDYRDTQNDLFTNEFFNDAFLNQDFSTPLNIPEEHSASPIKETLPEVNEQHTVTHDKTATEDESKQFLTYEKVWDRVQESEKAQSGELDIDHLCTQLKSKAKCSGSSAVYSQKDVDNLLGNSSEEQGDALKMFR